mgnify:CR=1 FL=1
MDKIGLITGDQVINHDAQVLIMTTEVYRNMCIMKDEMLEITRQIVQQAGITALMVTHDPQDALRFAEYAILVAEGQAQAPAPIGPLFDHPPPALQSYLGRRAP